MIKRHLFLVPRAILAMDKITIYMSEKNNLYKKRKRVEVYDMDLRRLEKFIKKRKVSFICSVDENGCSNVKAMLKPRKMNGLKEFYLSTNTSSLRVKQFKNNSNASIYFYHKGFIKYTGVMLVGKMEVLADQETKNMIWRKGDTIFCKKGVTDPDYCVLKFTARSGRYYCDLKTENFEV